MKNFKFLSVLFFINFCFTQTQKQIPEPTIDTMLAPALSAVEQLPEFLYERTTPIARLNNYNTLKHNTATKAFFEQALQELYKSSNSKKFIAVKNAKKHYVAHNNSKLNIVKIGLLQAKLHSLNYNDDDESKGALHFSNNTFTKINSKPIFIPNHVIVLAPLLNYAVGNTITYAFDEHLWFNDVNSPIKSVSTNFGTNRNYLVYNNGKFTKPNHTVTYNSSGYKTLKFIVTLQNGTTKTTFGKLHVKTVNAAQYQRFNDPLVESVNFTSTIPYQGYDEASPIYGELEYRIFYHTNNNNTQRQLLKPIIIIDGFDPYDKRRIQDSDSPLPDDEHTSIEEFMIYINSNNERIDLIPVLRNLGYDVILVNQPTYIRGSKTINGGADYIERNAMNHVSLYNHLNNTLFNNGSSEKLVIVGPSMGGQISRYALAYMEKHNMNHNTRLWVSIDSPHLGANIPIGIQSMIGLLDQFTDSSEAHDFYHNQLKSTAANQQLIAQHKAGHASDWLNGGSPIYQQYYSNLQSNGLPNSNGYPQNLRKIAIVNGSLTGTKVGREGEEDFRIHGFARQLWWRLKIIEMNTNYMPNIGQTKQVARLWRRFKPLRTATYTNNNPRGSLDILPGGLFDSENQIHKSILGTELNLFDDVYGFGDGPNFGDFFNAWIGSMAGLNDAFFETRTNKGVHSFIPTVSALGFYNSNFNWAQKLDRNLVCSNEIPFDSYFGPKNNEPHTSFTEASVNWLLKELAGNPQDPTVYLNGDDLLGNDVLCHNQTSNYNFANCKAPGTVETWSTSNNLSVNNSSTNSVTLTSNSSNSGIGFVKAKFRNGIEVKKEIWLGTPQITQSKIGSCYEPIVIIKESNTLANTNQIKIIYNGITSIFNGNSIEIDPVELGLDDGESSIVQVSLKNSCGWSPIKRIFINKPTLCDCGYGIGCDDDGISPLGGNDPKSVKLFKIYPNPASRIVNISLRDNLKTPSEQVIEGKLFDLYGRVKKTMSFSNNKSFVDISQLNTGVYVLKIYMKNTIENHQIIVK